MTVIYSSEKQRIKSIQDEFKMSKEEFAKKVLGYSDTQDYINYLDGKADLSMDSIRSLASYSNDINVGAIFSRQDGGSLFIDIKLEFERGSTAKKKIDYLNKEIEYLKNALEDKERIITILEKNQK